VRFESVSIQFESSRSFVSTQLQYLICFSTRADPQSEHQLATLLDKAHDGTSKDTAELATAVAVFRAIGLLRTAADPDPQGKPAEGVSSPVAAGIGEPHAAAGSTEVPHVAAGAATTGSSS
jgi:hypothetical protein